MAEDWIVTLFKCTLVTRNQTLRAIDINQGLFAQDIQNEHHLLGDSANAID